MSGQPVRFTDPIEIKASNLPVVLDAGEQGLRGSRNLDLGEDATGIDEPVVHIARIVKTTRNHTRIINPVRKRTRREGEVKRCEHATMKQKSMGHGAGILPLTHNVSGRVNAGRGGVDSAGKVDGGKRNAIR